MPHAHRVSSQEAPSTLLALGTLTHVTKPAGLRVTAVITVCWRQEGLGHPNNRPRHPLQCWQHRGTPRVPRKPDPQQGCPEICPDAGISQLAWVEQGFPWPAPAVGRSLQGDSCRGGKGTLILMVSCTRVACALCFKSLLCFGSSAAPPNPLLPPFSVGQWEGKGAEIWPWFPAVSNPWQSLQSHAVILLSSNTSSP